VRATSKTADEAPLASSISTRAVVGWVSKVSMQALYCTHSFSLVLCEELDYLAMYELVFIHGQGIFPKDSALWDGKCSSHGCSKARLVILKEACSGNPKTGNLTFKLAVPMCAITSKIMACITARLVVCKLVFFVPTARCDLGLCIELHSDTGQK